MNIFLKKLRAAKNCIKKNNDPEAEQALVRVFIELILVISFCIPWAKQETFTDILNSPANILILVTTSLSITLLVSILFYPQVSVTRRVLGITLDLIPLSILVGIAGNDAVYLFVFYLWVILGNGFRFGINYLYTSLSIGLIGFSTTISLSEYWQSNIPFSISLLLVITLIPLYSIFLIKKLYTAINMAEKANQAKSRFLANMSHELRTPLNGVLGLGDLLRETELEQEQRNLVNTMQSSAKILLGLIEKVLDISKIEAGKIVITQEPFDLHSIINSVMATQKVIAKTKSLQINSNIDSNIPFLLKGDQQYLRQILVNLIGNAIKFTDNGSINLNIFEISQKENATILRFEIKDTGIGIEKNLLSSVFDDFTQVGVATTRHIGGSGLGTTISKELVELMGGEIGVTSELSKGSTFWFELPFTVLPNPLMDISDHHLLILATESSKKAIQHFLNTWNLTADFVQSSEHALVMLKKGLSENIVYNTMMVDNLSLSESTPYDFIELLKSEKLLNELSLILLNPMDDYLEDNRIESSFTSVIRDLKDKRALFNALHKTQNLEKDNTKVISFSEFYATQNGAKRLNILIAEDNKVNQQVLSGILSRAGHSVVITDDGEQALEVLTKDFDQIDLLIVDKNMPKISGDEVIQALRFIDTSHSLPIIMLTADATTEARELGVVLGVNQFLTKPVDSHDLLEKIAVISKSLETKVIKKVNNTSKKAHQLYSIDVNKMDNLWCNTEVINELFSLDNDLQFMDQLIKAFIKDGDKHIKLIGEAISGDYLQYRESLHALKGAASELGADRLSDICAKGETYKPFDIGTEKLNLLFEEIKYTYNKTVETLNEILDKASTGKIK